MATKPASKTASKPGAVAVKKASNIVDIKAQLAAQVAAQSSKIAPPGGDVIGITQDKYFKLPDGTKTQGPLRVVVVDFTSANKFYEGAFDKDNITPPACFAIGDVPASLAPSKNAPLPQSPTCGTCPMNQFGSAGAGKACKNTRVLAVLPPDADEDAPLWILNVSPTGIKAFDSYVGGIARQFGLPPVGVVTELSFDESVSYASVRFGNPEPNENLTTHFARQEEAKDRLMAEPDVSQYEAPKPARAKPAAKRR